MTLCQPASIRAYDYRHALPGPVVCGDRSRALMWYGACTLLAELHAGRIWPDALTEEVIRSAPRVTFGRCPTRTPSEAYRPVTDCRGGWPTLRPTRAQRALFSASRCTVPA